jgi:pyruvate formate lyase activating enzyme
VWTDDARKVMNYCDLVLLDVKTTDDLLHQSYTGMARTNNHRWFEYLKEIGKPLWVRHVLVPGRTADEQHVRAVADYLRGYSDVIERVDLLPYHTMGVYKYEELGIDYPLEGVPPLSDERLEELRKLFFAHFQ